MFGTRLAPSGRARPDRGGLRAQPGRRTGAQGQRTVGRSVGPGPGCARAPVWSQPRPRRKEARWSVRVRSAVDSRRGRARWQGSRWVAGLRLRSGRWPRAVTAGALVAEGVWRRERRRVAGSPPLVTKPFSDRVCFSILIPMSRFEVRSCVLQLGCDRNQALNACDARITTNQPRTNQTASNQIAPHPATTDQSSTSKTVINWSFTHWCSTSQTARKPPATVLRACRAHSAHSAHIGSRTAEGPRTGGEPGSSL